MANEGAKGATGKGEALEYWARAVQGFGIYRAEDEERGEKAEEAEDDGDQQPCAAGRPAFDLWTLFRALQYGPNGDGIGTAELSHLLSADFAFVFFFGLSPPSSILIRDSWSAYLLLSHSSRSWPSLMLLPPPSFPIW
jgi:hypothetical protein